MSPWKESKERILLAVRQVRSFVKRIALSRVVSWEVGQPENLASTPSEVSQLPVPGSL